MQQIGDQLGVSAKTICLDLWEANDEYRAEYLPYVKRWHTRQVAQTEALILAHWPNRHTKPSADVILKALERQARLLGTDAPVKITPTNIDGSRPYGQDGDASIDAKITALLAETAGPNALPVIDVSGNGHSGNGDGRKGTDG